MAHWRRLLERDHLGAWDLVDSQGKPKDFTLTIESVTQRKVYSQKVQGELGKPLIRFEGARKPLIIGATLGETIERMYGSDDKNWIGKRVTLYQDVTSVGKKKGVPCIRIRPVVPSGPAEKNMPDRPVDPEMRAKQDAAFEREPGEEG